MRVLRLSNSADWYGNVPDDHRSPALAARALAEVSGQPVESMTREIWPNAALADVLDGWLAKHRPDVVFLWVAPYWFTFEIIDRPPHLKGRLPRSLGRLAKRAHVKRPITRQMGRIRHWYVVRRTGARLLFQPEEVLERMEQCIGRILAHEETTLVVRGPELPLVQFETRAGRRRAEQRRLIVHRGLEAFCQARHVTYLGVKDGLALFDRGGQLMADGIHRSASAHLELGSEEAAAMATAWREANA
jgi:hypothetical protein